MATKTTIRLMALTAAIALVALVRSSPAEDLQLEPEWTKKAIEKLGGRIERKYEFENNDGKQFKTLRVVFSNSNLTDADLQRLAEPLSVVFNSSCKQENVLDLSYTRITGKGIRALAGVKKVTCLDVSHTLLCDEGLGELASLSGLNLVYFENDHLTLSGFRSFVRGFRGREIAVSLDSAVVAEESVTSEGRLVMKRVSGDKLIAALADLDRLIGIDLTDVGLKDSDLAGLEPVSRCLKWLDLSFNKDLTNGAADWAASRQPSHLWHLNLSGIENIRDEDGRHELASALSKLGCLTSLNLATTKITDKVLENLKNVRLKRLILSETQTAIDHKALCLDECQVYGSLTTLYVDSTGIKDTHDFEMLQQLSELDVSKTAVTDAALESFVQKQKDAKRGKLKRLVFDDTNTSKGLLHRLRYLAQFANTPPLCDRK